MKLHGEKLYAAHEKTVNFLRGEEKEMVEQVASDGVTKELKPTGRMVPKVVRLTVRGIVDDSAFEKLCPRPQPPARLVRGGSQTLNYADPAYRKAVDDWATSKTYWLILQSLAATKGLEWESVKMDDPTTWANYEQELKDSGFVPHEIARLILAVNEVNGMSQEAVDAALGSFSA